MLCGLPSREIKEESQSWEVKQRGGHFAAMEQPKVLAEEIRAFFRQFRHNLGKVVS